jgi:signal-transduction protein with cAMP-binding, CBS, and nucleotidyltransferase domain
MGLTPLVLSWMDCEVFEARAIHASKPIAGTAPGTIVWPKLQAVCRPRALEGTLRDEIIAALQSSEMFRNLPSRQLQRIRDAGKELSFTAGSKIVAEGEETGRFFLILAGSAEVTVQGKTRGTLGRGTSFGAIELLDGGPRSATVTAVTNLRTFSLSSWNFEPFLRDESITQVVIRSLCQRLRRAEVSAYT